MKTIKLMEKDTNIMIMVGDCEVIITNQGTSVDACIVQNGKALDSAYAFFQTNSTTNTKE